MPFETINGTDANVEFANNRFNAVWSSFSHDVENSISTRRVFGTLGSVSRSTPGVVTASLTGVLSHGDANTQAYPTDANGKIDFSNFSDEVTLTLATGTTVSGTAAVSNISVGPVDADSDDFADMTCDLTFNNPDVVWATA